MFCLFCLFCTTPAGLANKVKVIAVGLYLTDADTFRVLPNIALLASYAVSSIIDLPVGTAYAVEDPVIFFSQLFQCLFLLLNFSLQMPLRKARLPSLYLLTVLGKMSKLFFVQN